MNKRIIYPTTNGEVCIVIPSPTWEGTMEDLAFKDVPSGVPYKIVDVFEIPSDRTFRSAWEYQE